MTALARSLAEWYVTATLAPSRANRRAIALPIPELDPVIRAVFPFNVSLMLILSLRRFCL